MTKLSESRIASAEQLKQFLIDSSPLIEEYTVAVCPVCTDICCRQKHGLYREGDRRYLACLGEPVPDRDPARPLEGPCEAMGPRGCRHPRWQRPFRCTWWFCEPLLAALNAAPSFKMRKVSALLQKMCDLYGELNSGEP